MVLVEQQGYDLKINGKTYESQEAIYRDFKLDAEMLKYRLDKGMSVEEALGVEKYMHSGNSLVIEHGGLVYNSLSELCSVRGYKYSRVYSWMKKGYSLDDALKKAKKSDRALIEIEVEGVLYPSISSAAKHYGLSPAKVVARLNTGWTIRQAFDLAPRNRVHRERNKSVVRPSVAGYHDTRNVSLDYDMVKSSKVNFIHNIHS